MGRRVFLDVGANTGQTLAAVVDLRFDWIVCFEPVGLCQPYLRRCAYRRPKITIHPYGLWNRNTEATVYDPGAKGAGMWIKEKRNASKLAGKPIAEEVCKFRKASEWFNKYLTDSDIVFLKLNCEGAECDIIDDLIDSGEFRKVTYAMIDFDAIKIKDMAHRVEETKRRLAQYPRERVGYSKQVMVGDTHKERILNWLSLTGGCPELKVGKVKETAPADTQGLNP